MTSSRPRRDGSATLTSDAALDEPAARSDIDSAGGSRAASGADPAGADGAPAGRSDIRILGRPVEVDPHHCFACGSLNTHGLQLVLHADDDQCWTELALPPRFEGWEAIAHGGIVCTILDEVMAWALINHDTWGVTARMSVDFKRPVEIGAPVRAEGRVVEARRRIFRTEGVILSLPSRTVLASAEGVYVAASDHRKRELQQRYGFRYVDPPPGSNRGTRDGVDSTATADAGQTAATNRAATASGDEPGAGRGG